MLEKQAEFAEEEKKMEETQAKRPDMQVKLISEVKNIKLNLESIKKTENLRKQMKSKLHALQNTKISIKANRESYDLGKPQLLHYYY